MSWFRRHKGWTTMFILTLVSFVWGMVGTGDPFTIGRITGWIWFLYLVMWAIWGRKRGW